MACTALDLQNMDDNLPRNFKCSLSEVLQKRFEYEFHSASYSLLNEVVMGLRVVIGHLLKVLLVRLAGDYGDLESQTVLGFMLNLYEHSKELSVVLQEIGIKSALPSHLSCLDDLRLAETYSCLTLFFIWVEDGLYDFNYLPFPLKVHLHNHDRLFVENQFLNWQGCMSDLKEEVLKLICILKLSESDIASRVTKAASVSIFASTVSSGSRCRLAVAHRDYIYSVFVCVYFV